MIDLLAMASWKGTALIAGALLLLAFFGRVIPARWRHALLLVALLRFVLPVAPPTSFSVFNLTRFRTEEAQVRTLILPTPRPMSVSFVRSPAPPPGAPSSGWIATTLFSIWAVGVVAFVLRLAGHSLAMRQRVLRARPLQRRDLLALLTDCRGTVNVRRDVRLLVTPEVSTPSLHGWLRPALLLPSGVAETMSTDQLRFIFLHELAHLRRSDVLLNWITAVVHTLHWFNPLVWFAVTRIDEERELACDALALEHLEHHERSAYGETVLQLIDRFGTPRLIPGVVGMVTDKHQLKRRILMIATFRNDSRRSALFGALVAILALVTLTDARAEERRMLHPRFQRMRVTPEGAATMKKLDRNISLSMTDAPVADVLSAAISTTGVFLNDAALDSVVRQARVTVKAENIPAHIVLMETLSALRLGLTFDQNGATIVKVPEGEDAFEMRADASDLEEGATADRVIIVHKGAKGELARHDGTFELPAEPPAGGHRVIIKKFEKTDDTSSKDGVVRRKVQIRGSEEGQPEGTLDLEVRTAAAPTAH